MRLFDRIGKQVSLTHQGELFYRYAVSLTHNLEEIREGHGRHPGAHGTLALGTIESICSSIIPPILSEYHRRFPQVSVSITIDSPQALLEMMNENALDIVYFLDKRLYDQRWIKVLEEPEEIVFAASSAHPLRRQKESGPGGGRRPAVSADGESRQLPQHPGQLPGLPPEKHPSLPGDRQHDFILQMLRGQYGALPAAPLPPSRRTSSGERSPPWT